MRELLLKNQIDFKSAKAYCYHMFDDLPPSRKDNSEFPRDLENMSLHELETYMTELQNEMSRVQADIESKKASQEAAASAFKS